MSAKPCKRYRTVTAEGVGSYGTHSEALRATAGETSWSIWGVVGIGGSIRKVFLVSESVNHARELDL